MKNLLLILALFVGNSFTESNKVCEIEYPPPIDYQHFYLDDFLFTSSSLAEYDSNDKWIEPGCFKQYFMITETNLITTPNGTYETIEEPWFKQKVVWEDSSYKNISLYKRIIGKKRNYGIFTANTFGNRSSYILVFQTKPKFKEISVINGYIDSETTDGFTISENAPWSVAGECENISNATWPQQTVSYIFSDKGFETKIMEEGECYIP
tara:strand:- start:845 stop:1471 length:627 start_codon:yes stop_codon:yes gene_type:complete